MEPTSDHSGAPGWHDQQPIGAVIKQARSQAGKSQEALAEALRAASGSHSINRGAVGRWEHGKRIPVPYWRRHLSTVLHIPIDVLDRAAAVARAQRAGGKRTTPDLGWRAPLDTALDTVGPSMGEHLRPASGEARPRTSSTMAIPERLGPSGEGSRGASVVGHPPMEQRWLLRIGDESARFAQRIETTNVGAVTLEQLEQDMEQVAQDYLSQPVMLLVEEIRHLRDQAFHLLEGRQRRKQARLLYVIAGRMCGLLAAAASDRLGTYDAAGKHARTAWLCAEEAEDDELKAWVLSIQSTIEFWRDNHHRAAKHARAGQRYVRRGIELVRLASLEARACGRLGDRDGVQRAVRLATTAREKVTSSDEVRHVGIFAFPLANQVRCAGTAYLWLCDVEGAERARDELLHALRLFELEAPGQSYAHIAVTRADLAVAQLRLGELDAAAEAIQPVLALPADRRLAGVVRRSGELRRLLTMPRFEGSALARDLDQALERFCAASIPRRVAQSMAS